MKAAHQGVPVAALPGSQAGGLFSNIAQAMSPSTAVSSPSSVATRPAADASIGSGPRRRADWTVG